MKNPFRFRDLTLLLNSLEWGATYEEWLRGVCGLPESHVAVGVASAELVALLTKSHAVHLREHSRRSDIL